jgi:hypothetical protein
MANVNHSVLTDPNLHEPKGIAAASNEQVYVSNGTGTGNWTFIKTLIELSFEGYLEDVSSVEKVHVPMPFLGEVKKVVVVLEDSISSADPTLTVRDSSGLSMGTITIPHLTSAAGRVHTLGPTVNNVVTENSFITIESDGASTNSAKLRFTVIVDRIV